MQKRITIDQLMRTRQFTVVCLLVLLGGAALAVPSVAVYNADLASQEESESGVQFGEQVSSFAQSSAVEASESVEAGLWEAAFNNTANQTGVIEERAATLEARMRSLQDRIGELEQRRENLSQAAYTARASALRTRVSSLQSHIERTNETAARVGVDRGNLDALRNEAANLTGPEVSERARNITDVSRGPPEDAGPPDDNERGNNLNQGGPDNAGPGNDTEQEPPTEGNETEQGPPDDTDPGSGEDDPAAGSGEDPPADDKPGDRAGDSPDDGSERPPDDGESGPPDDSGNGPP